LDLTERAFLAASRQRAKAIRWKAVSASLAIALLTLVVSVGGLAYRWYKNGEVAEARAIEDEREQGRSAILHGEMDDARKHLTEARRRGDNSPATEFMLARALQPRLAEVARLPADTGRMWWATFSPDGRQIVTTDDKAAQIWDAKTYQRLFLLP